MVFLDLMEKDQMVCHISPGMRENTWCGISPLAAQWLLQTYLPLCKALARLLKQERRPNVLSTLQLVTATTLCPSQQKHLGLWAPAQSASLMNLGNSSSSTQESEEPSFTFIRLLDVASRKEMVPLSLDQFQLERSLKKFSICNQISTLSNIQTKYTIKNA